MKLRLGRELAGGGLQRRGPPAIAAWSARGLLESGVNVRRARRTGRPGSPATLTTSFAACSSPGNSCRPARARVEQVGRHRLQVVDQRMQPASAWLRSAPRPANASPNTSRLDAEAAPGRRVEHLQEVVDLDRQAGVRGGIVAPAASVWLEWPRSSSRYLRPSGDTGRTRSVVSAGSGSIDLSAQVKHRDRAAVGQSYPRSPNVADTGTADQHRVRRRSARRRRGPRR